MVTLNMWIWGEGEASEQLIKREIRAFNIKFPDLEIHPTSISWRDAWDSIVMVAQEEKGPDVLQIGSTWNGTLAALGVLKDITREFNEANFSKDMFAPAALTNCYFPHTDQMGFLPWFVDLRALYYRRDILKTLEMSEENLSDWTSFEKVCERIKGFKKGDKEIKALGVSGRADALILHNISPWIWSAGGDFLSPDGKRAIFNSREVLDALEFYIGLVSKGYIPVSALKLWTEEVAKNFFVRGDYAIAIPGPLGGSTALNPTDPDYNAEVAGNCVPALFPAGKAGRYIFLEGAI